MLLAAAALGCVVGCASIDPHMRYQDVESSKSDVRRVLTDQAAAWNRGDVHGFMKGYWKSELLTFSSGGGTQRGWQATYDRYTQRYPTPERMGRLTFSDLEIQFLDADARRAGSAAALVLGRWYLHRSPDPVGGNFSLVMRKFDPHGWLVIHDHTSVDPKAAAPTVP